MVANRNLFQFIIFRHASSEITQFSSFFRYIYTHACFSLFCRLCTLVPTTTPTPRLLEEEIEMAASAASSESQDSAPLTFQDIIPDPKLYDKMKPPKLEGYPTKVSFHVTVMGLDSINEYSMVRKNHSLLYWKSNQKPTTAQLVPFFIMLEKAAKSIQKATAAITTTTTAVAVARKKGLHAGMTSVVKKIGFPFSLCFSSHSLFPPFFVL